ncbi:MAG: hypothetical protein C4547_14525 [Phycisphaerales bacterium]|nr:MAG: hypothetical protein C4547_14525 [Phycisphaerales bacterium]
MARKKKVAKKKSGKKKAALGARTRAARPPAGKKGAAGKKTAAGKAAGRKKGAAGKRTAGKTKATRGVKKKPAMRAAASRRATAARRPPAPRRTFHQRPSSWLDAHADVPVIEQAARKMTTFMEAMADGIVDDAEVQAQERRLVALMKEVEPQLDDALHASVTRLLIELTAYDLMQVLCAMHKARSQTTFKG